MIHFEYKRIGASLVEQLTRHLDGGKSAVLLGPRHVGKRYVFRRVRDDLQKKLGHQKIGIVRFLARENTDRPVRDEDMDLGAAGVRLFGPADDVFGWVDGCLAESDGTVVLMAANVDALPHQKGKEFLTQLRTRVEATAGKPRRVAALLSGEIDLQELVYGPNSEFNSASRYVLQGFDEAEFRAFAETYVDGLGIDFEEPDDEVYEHLFQRTGGNAYLLRLMLWTVFDAWAAHGDTGPQTYSVRRLQDRDVAAMLPINSHFRYLMRLIGRSPQVWGTLEKLIHNHRVPVSSNEPHLFELAGIAVRDQLSTALMLPPDSVMGELVRSYYTTRRFGDLHAGCGQWDKALEHYRAHAREHPDATPDTRVRPITIDDVPEVDQLVQALSLSLYQEATNGSDAVKKRFADGCRDLLGFTEVTFWAGPPWHAVPGGGGDELDASPVEYEKVLPEGPLLTPGLVELKKDHLLRVAVALLPPLPSGQNEAVIVGNPRDRTNLSRARRRLVADLVRHFLVAYQHARQTERDRERLKVRELAAEIVTGIFANLGSTVKDVETTLAHAGAGLKKLGYSRIMFSLVNPTGTHIVGVHEVSDDPNREVERMTRYRLDESPRDIQPYVVREGKSAIIADAAKHPLTHKDLVNKVGMRGIAVVPLRNFGGVVIGTVHVEWPNKRVPTAEEVEDLERFGRYLAVAVEQSARVNMLQSALDKQPEPMYILDSRRRVRYANKPACELFAAAPPLEPGWHDAQHARSIDDWQGAGAQTTSFTKVAELTRRSLDTGDRQVGHVRFSTGETRHGEFLSEGITDERDERVGVFCHLKDFTYLYRVFRAIRKVQEANTTQEVIDNTVEAIQMLDLKWGRLYQIDKDDPTLLRSKACYGGDSEEFRKVFAAGEIVLTPRGQPNAESTWACFDGDSPVPVVFCHLPDRADSAAVGTSRGLQARNVLVGNCPPQVAKKLGDYWIDFPLVAGADPVGKLTLSCEEGYRPEDFEFLKVLCEVTTNLLDASTRWEREFNDKTKWMEDNAERVIQDTCHHVATNLAAFPVILENYRLLAGDDPELAEVNADFETAYDHVNKLMTETRDRLLRLVVKVGRADIVEVVRRAFAGQPPALWELSADSEPSLPMDLDATTFESVVLQLIHNAQQCHQGPTPLAIRVRVRSVLRGGQEWVRLDFADNGPGIPGEFKTRIFEQYFSRRPQGERGTGIGLYFVRRVIVAHLGTVQEIGAPGEGAVFRIDLPRLAAESSNGSHPCSTS